MCPPRPFADNVRVVVTHLIDGTYELFRHFYGLRRFKKQDPPYGAVAGVLHTVLGLIEKGATHIGVATDHVVESFRNGLWPGYKTGEGIEPALLAQFHPLEDALAAQGGRGERVVQMDRRANKLLDAGAVRAKYGVEPQRIPDLLALVGDSADGYPGIDGIGEVTARRLINRYGAIEDFPPENLATERRELALLFKRLATLRADAALFSDGGARRGRAPADSFEAWAAKIGDARLLARSRSALQ